MGHNRAKTNQDPLRSYFNPSKNKLNHKNTKISDYSKAEANCGFPRILI